MDGAIADDYYLKSSEPVMPSSRLPVQVEFVEPFGPDKTRLLYARSAYRHEPEFNLLGVSRRGEIDRAPKAKRMIESESKVSDNYQRLVSKAIDDLFGGEQDRASVPEIRERLVGRVRDAMLELFPDLELQGPGHPIAGGTFYFRKDGRPRFHYKNLSGGEKAAFDLLLDLVVKGAYYDDTVFCIDEPELHMNARIQGQLLTSILKLMPLSGQLWIATHSIGMMRGAQRLFEADESSVAFLDFEGHDFDSPVKLEPVRPDRDFWTRTLYVALGDLAALVGPDCVVLCEGRPLNASKTARSEFDARCYATIFSSEFPRTCFMSVGNSQDVQEDRVGLGRAIETIVSGTRVIKLVDRDMQTDSEVRENKARGERVLTRRHLESYLLSDEMVAALCERSLMPEKVPDLIAARDAALATSVEARKNDPDDVKRAAGDFYTAARRILGLVQAGNSVEAFLAETMSPLMRSDMNVYAELKGDIFGGVS